MASSLEGEVIRVIRRLPPEDPARILDVPPTPTVVGNRVEDIKTQARRSVQALLDDAYTVSMAE